MAKQVQQLRFVQFEWFSPRQDERTSEGFYTPLQEDFYHAYLNIGAAFRSHRVCNIESIVAVAGEHIRPYLSDRKSTRLNSSHTEGRYTAEGFSSTA